jgi:alditol oxidase
MSAGSTITNWAGNVRFRAEHVHEPADVAHLQEIVAGARRVKALGSGHSFNRIADTDGDLISMAALPRTVEVDATARTATIAGGVRFGHLGPILEQHGLALPNLGSLPHISVAGACATGTHGSGNGNGNLATAVRDLTMVGADGELRTISGPDLAASVVSLGALGIVTALTLDLRPTYRIQQFTYHGLSTAQLIANIDEIMAAAYSVSVFTTWTDDNRVWLKRLESVEAPAPTWLGATLATQPDVPGPGSDPQSVTQQLGVAGPWFERLPHFRLEFTPSWGAELQSEYFVSRPDAAEAVRAVFDLRERLAPVLLTSELRTVAADDLWISPAQGQDVLALHFTWTADESAVASVVAELERRLAPFDARPHWGKVNSVDPAELARRYPLLRQFAARVREWDPDGVFTNDYLEQRLPR